MSLSKENYDKLNKDYLYKKEPTINNSFYVGYIPEIYHCKNWTFIVSKLDDGRAFMLDTYFKSYDSHCIQVTDENIDEFKVVFDFKEVKQIRDTEADEYNKEDLYYVATNSGGFSCGGLWWVKKDAVKSKELLINKAREKVESLKRQLRWAEDDLEKLVGKL